MTIFQKIRLRLLRRRALRLYTQYMQHRSRYDCGDDLARQMSPTLDRLAFHFNATMDKIRTLDPEAPAETRL